MAGAFRIAEGYVEVTADESGYDRAMDRLKSKRNKATVTLDIDDTAALAKLRRFADQHSRTVLKAVIDADLNQATIRRVTGQLDRLTADRVVNIRASVDTRVAAQELQNLTQRRTVRIGIDVDTRVAADSLANLTRRRQMTIQANADTAAARARLDALTRDRTVNVRANVSGGLGGLGGGASNSAAGIGILSSRLANLIALAVGALPTVASLGQSIVAMGPAAALAAPAVLSLGAAFAAIKVGTSGIGDAFKAAFAPAVSSGNAAATATRRVEDAQRSLAKAQQGVKDAEVRAAEARVQAARRIEDSQRSLKSTVQDAADANRRAAEQVEQAEQDLTDAQRSARQAQLDLTAARKDAARQLEDLANQQEDVELDRREAVLRVQDAQDDLNKTLADPKATEKQRQEAQLTYDQAVQHLDEIQLQQQRLASDAEAANKAGIEGSKQVADAKQQVADANQSISDKTRALKDAELEASRTQVEGAQKIAAAERDVADAREAARKAAVDGARDIADAQAAVADAARSLADAQTAGAAAVNKTAEAMARLAPNARAFVSAVIAQASAWRALKLDVQNALFAGLGQKFTTMSTAILPSLRQGLTGTAGVLNTMAKNAFDAVTNLGKTGQLKQLFAGLNDGLKPLSKIPGQFITGLTQIGIAASPAFERVTTAAGGFADRLSQQLTQAFKNGHLEKIIDQALDIAVQFGHLVGDIFGTLGNVMKAAGAAGGDALGALGSVFKELRRITAMPEVQKALTEIFKAVNAIAKLIAVGIGAVVQAALPLLAALAPIVTELAQKFAPVLVDLVTTLGKALMPIIDALLPVISDIGDIVVGLVRGLLPLLEPLGKLIGAIVTALAPVVSALGAQLVPVIAALAKGLAPVIEALVPAVQSLGQFIGQLAPLFPQLLVSLLPLIPPLAQLVISFLDLALQVITPLMPLIVTLAQLLTGALAKSINDLVPPLVTVIGWLVTFTDAVTDAVKWTVDQFKWALGRAKETFTQLKQAVMDRWNSLWKGATDRWNSFWTGLRTSLSNAKTSMTNWVSGVKTSITNSWSSMWTSVTSRTTSAFSTLRSKISEFKTSMLNSVKALRDGVGTLWAGIQSKFAGPVRWVVSNVYNNGLRKMWNSIAGKINSKISLPAISLGFSQGGVVPGKRSNRDSVPAMLAPGERVLSNGQVDQLGGHRGIDAMLGKDRPTKTGGNPSRQEERRRYQGPVQHFADGGIIGKVTGAVGGAVSSAASWAKNLVVGGLKDAAAKALSALVRPLINRIPGGAGLGGLLKGLSNRAVDGMMSWFTSEDKKAKGGPAVQKALSWARTQNGKPYQWGGNNNPSWDCSGLVSGIESVIRGERPHRRWATGSFVGNSGPAGWVRNLNSPYMIGITNAGVGHTAGTLAGVNVESRGGDGVVIGKGARGYNDSLFTSRWGYAPVAKYDQGGLLADGATMVVKQTRKPERVLDPRQTELFEQLVTGGGGTAGSVTIEHFEVNIDGTLDLTNQQALKRLANSMPGYMNEALRRWNKERAR